MWSLAKIDPVEQLIEAGKFSEAQPLIEKRLEETPGDPYLLYNLALTHYAAGDFEEAVVLWEKVRMASDQDLVTKAMAQIGNASYRISEVIQEEGRQEDATIQLRRAQHSLQAAVERDDDYDVAVQNFDFVSKKLVAHLVQQGNSKIEKSESKWVKGERDLVLYRSALTDYEEALSIRPDDEAIQKLVNDTRQKMTDYLMNSGEKNLSSAEKTLKKVKEPTAEDRLTSEEGRELNRAQNEISEAVANFEDAASISPDDQEAANALEEARKKASDLMKDIADKWRENSEALDDSIAQMQERRQVIQAQLKNEEDETKRSELGKENKDLAREMSRQQYHADLQAERALEDYEQALSLNPDNQEAFAEKWKLEQKMSEKHEAKADANLQVAQQALQNIEDRQPRLEQMREQLETAPENKLKGLENEIEKYENYQASSAQHAADRLLKAKTDLEKSTQLDPSNESAQQKLEQTNAHIADVLEQAADLQLAIAERLQDAGKDDQAIARQEMAIKNFDSALALSEDEQQQAALVQKMAAARQDLLSQRNARAQQLATQQQQQQVQQPGDPNAPQQLNAENAQEVAMEYKEMVQFAEDQQGSEEFGNFDTKAMKRVVKDW